jgi:uncharacterized protein YecE (DUF72 family)
LAQHLELRYAASVFSTVEINGSFYSLQAPNSWIRWHAETPDDFMFSVKGPRFITHMLRLRDVDQPLANFFASGLLALKEKLGPILWQLPPFMRFDFGRLEAFMAILPRDTASALTLARRRHRRMFGRSHLAIDIPRPLRYAIEIRHESFLDARFIALLREHNAALVIAETAQKWPMPHDVTADFMYVRLHGDRDLYRSGYGVVALTRWAERIAAWHAGEAPAHCARGGVHIAGGPAPSRAGGRDVFCYFDNSDAKHRAPADARTLMRKLIMIDQGSASVTARRHDVRASCERSSLTASGRRYRAGSVSPDEAAFCLAPRDSQGGVRFGSDREADPSVGFGEVLKDRR